MAVNRQQNFLGQQRVDVPHLRSLESAVCYDFDAIGLIITAGIPCVVSGFEILNYTNLVGTLASSITIETASSQLVHPLASDSGSFFQVPSNRTNETLNSFNSRVQGSFLPNTINYVGVDLLRTSDATTVGNVKFLTTNPDTETTKRVPLARTMDYLFTISTTPFSVSQSICSLYIIETDTKNTIVSVTDARNLLFRNAAGGDSPNTNNPYGWPGTRNEVTATNPLIAGDKSIQSLKQWLNASMTRLQELGGGEYWYSLTADRNIRMIQTSFFVSNGEAFEWDGTNLHWKGLKFLFDNSTATINEIADQITDSSGLTNLANGECIYVDLDRSTNHIVGGTPLNAQKAVLATLGGSSIPGQRWVLAFRSGSNIYVRDQPFPVGSSFKLATVAAVGVIRTTINANGTISDPIAVGLADSAAGFYTATCGGISHNTDRGVSTLIGSGDLVIGRGSAAGDGGITIQSNTEGKPVVLYGKTNFATSSLSAIKVIQGNIVSNTNRIIEFACGGDLPTTADTSSTVASIENEGSIGLAIATHINIPGSVRSGDYINQKLFIRADKSYVTTIDAIFSGNGGCIGGFFYNYTETPTGTWTRNANGALSSSDLQGVTPVLNMRLLVCEAQRSGTRSDRSYGIYILDQVGDSTHPTILTRDSSYLLYNGVTFYNNATVGVWHKCYIKLDTPDPIILDIDDLANATPLYFSVTNPDVRNQLCVMNSDGSVTPISSSVLSIIGD